jgi:hypothetical protein
MKTDTIQPIILFSSQTLHLPLRTAAGLTVGTGATEIIFETRSRMKFNLS